MKRRVEILEEIKAELEKSRQEWEKRLLLEPGQKLIFDVWIGERKERRVPVIILDKEITEKDWEIIFGLTLLHAERKILADLCTNGNQPRKLENANYIVRINAIFREQNLPYHIASPERYAAWNKRSENYYKSKLFVVERDEYIKVELQKKEV